MMSYNLLELIFTRIAYLVLGLISATAVGSISFMVWMFLVKGTSKFYIKYSMIMLKVTMLGFVLPLLPFGVVQVLNVAETRHRNLFLAAPVAKYLMAAAVLWIAVMLCMIVRWVLQSRSKRFLCSANKPVMEDDIRETVEKWKKRLSIQKKTTLFYNELVTSPMIIYNRGYQILIPVYPIRKEQLNIALLHELVHLKHGDILLKKYMLVINALHSINPFCYWLRTRMTNWMEAYCDYICCEIGGDEFDCKEYFSCILSLKEQSEEKLWKNMACSLFDGNNTLQFRLDMLKLTKEVDILPLHKRAAAAAVCLVVVLVLTSGTVSYGLNCWVEHTMVYQKVEQDKADFEEVARDDIFGGAQVQYLEESIVGARESTDFSMEPGKIYVCNLPDGNQGMLSLFAEGDCGKCQLGYVTEDGRTMCMEGFGDLAVGLQEEPDTVRQVFIKNCEEDSIPIELIIHDN